MERFVSDPLSVPPPSEGYCWSSAELLVYGVDHSGPSYEVRVFVDAPDADAQTPLELDAGYAGCFTVFGHGGCYGDDDHCDPNARFSDVYDVRLPHQSELPDEDRPDPRASHWGAKAVASPSTSCCRKMLQAQPIDRDRQQRVFYRTQPS